VLHLYDNTKAACYGTDSHACLEAIRVAGIRVNLDDLDDLDGLDVCFPNLSVHGTHTTFR
jgi:hypothetical protein